MAPSVCGVMALPGKTVVTRPCQISLMASQDAQLVVDHDVVPGRIKLLHFVQLLFFVDIYQHVPLNAFHSPERSTLRG